MKYVCKIAGQEIEIRDGFTINEEMNEKLDSGTFQFCTENGMADIESFDPIVFSAYQPLATTRKKLLIDTFDSEIEEFKDNLDESSYFYTVNIFSESKILERITLPSLSISERADGSSFTVWNKIKEYCLAYLPRILVYSSASYGNKTIRCCLEYDRALEQKFSMPCPEMSWQTPTLKEVLNDLFNVADCIPVVKDNVLTFFDLGLRGQIIDQSKLTNKKNSGSSADYCDELTIPMQNVISKTKTITEYVTPRTTDSSELTTENMCIVTQKPIYKIKSFRILACSLHYYDTYTKRHLFDIDLINAGQQYDKHDFIVEEEEYKILNPRRKSISGGAAPHKYQCFNLYYKRGSNIITNLGESIKYNTDLTTSNTESRLSLAFAAARAIGQGGDASSVNKYFIDGEDIRKTIIKIEYETIDETTLHVGKLGTIKNQNNRLFDEQKVQTVNIDKQTIHEYAKANRLGNRIDTIYGEYENESEIPNLGDTIGDKVLFSRSVTYWDNILMFKGELIDNYILRDYFTGVLSKRRSWAIPGNQDSVVRHDNIKFYATASFTHQKLQLTSVKMPYSISNHYENIVNALNGVTLVGDGLKMTGIASWYEGKEGNIPELGDRIFMESNMFVTGRSFVCCFGFTDNMAAGYAIDYGDEEDYINKIISYCDTNGEISKATYYVCHHIESNETGQSIQSSIEYLENPDNWGTEQGEETFEDMIYYANKKPVVSYDSFSNEEFFTIVCNHLNKDVRETLKTTIQIEFTSDTENIIVTDKLASYCSYNFEGQLNLKFYQLRRDKYRPTDIKGRGVLKRDWRIRIYTYPALESGESGYQRLVLLDNGELGANDNWCVCDEENNILMAINGQHTEIYFEIRPFRDNKVYNSVIDRVPIGISSDSDSLPSAYNSHQPTIGSITVLGRVVPKSDFKWFEENDD